MESRFDSSDVDHPDDAAVDRMDFAPWHGGGLVQLAAVDFLVLGADVTIERDEPARIVSIGRSEVEHRLLGAAALKNTIDGHAGPRGRALPELHRNRRAPSIACS